MLHHQYKSYLKGKPERLVCRSCWWYEGVKSLDQSGSAGLAFLALYVPPFVPRHVGAGQPHVVSVPSRDRDEWDSNMVISNLLDEVIDFLLDFFEPNLTVRRIGRVHLVDCNDKLLDSQGQHGVFFGLTILGDTSLELTEARGDDMHTTISLEKKQY